MNELDNALAFLSRMKQGAKDEFSYGKEDHRMIQRRAREAAGLEREGTMFEEMMGSNRTATLLKELVGKGDEEFIKARKAAGMGLSDDLATKIGQVGGVLASDLVQDRSRAVWWLLNAPQAAAQVIQDEVVKRAAPDLYKTDLQVDSYGNPIKSKQAAHQAGIADKDGRPNVGYSRTEKGYSRRRHGPGSIRALDIPTGLAINTGIGMMTPFGGAEGYKAVFPDEEDPSKTTNVIGEVGAKYILGRTGGLLPWDEFKKVRPDVSKDEYMAYKSFKHDNRTDLNPFDGDFEDERRRRNQAENEKDQMNRIDTINQ